MVQKLSWHKRTGNSSLKSELGYIFEHLWPSQIIWALEQCKYLHRNKNACFNYNYWIPIEIQSLNACLKFERSLYSSSITDEIRIKAQSAAFLIVSRIPVTFLKNNTFNSLFWSKKYAMHWDIFFNAYRNWLDCFQKIRQSKVLIRLFCWNKHFRL